MKNTLWVCLLCAAPLFAEAPPPPPPIVIHRTAGSIRLNADLSDPGWKGAATIDRFYETSPGDNIPPKVKTIAYLTYDDRYFYIGVRCEDPDPGKIRAPFVERDNVIGTDDNIAIFLDTRNDKRTAMELRVNPRGIQGDAIFDDANGNEDFSPDFFYDTAAKIDSGGWTAEFRIPFSSLRYPEHDVQQWNIIIWRNYPREFCYAFQSVPVPRNSNCYMCHLQPIAGLTGLPKAAHLVAAPYVTALQSEVPTGALGTALQRQPLRSNAGLDVKWTPSANQAVDLTVNPDFSQIEADVPQITVNQRFALFFPEKRPFFLEGFDLFDTPIQVAYTRTITAPKWGTRSTGKIAGSQYTVLVTRDDGGGSTIIPGATSSFFAPQDFKSFDTIGRIRHDIGSSFVGAVLTDREISGGGYNRVIGPDFQWRPNQGDAVTGEALVSSTENPNRPDLSASWNGVRTTSTAFHADWNHQRQSYDAGLAANDIGNGFRADLGFLPQVGYREADGYFGLRHYPQHGMFNFIRASFFADRQEDTAGREIFRRTSPGILFLGIKNLQAGLTVHLSEQVRVANRLLNENYVEWFSQIDPSRRFTRIALNAVGGQQIDFANGRVGNGATLGVTSTLRPIDRLEFDLVLNHAWLDANHSRVFTANVERLKTTFSFSDRSLVRIIGQYVANDSGSSHSGHFLGSALYTYRLNWQTVLFLGYGDDRELTLANTLARLDRSVFFKVSYAIQR